MSEIIYRPIPVAQIKNNNLRRFLMIVLFLPIVLIGWLLIILISIKYFIRSIVKQPIELFQGMVTHWNKPLDTTTEE